MVVIFKLYVNEVKWEVFQFQEFYGKFKFFIIYNNEYGKFLQYLLKYLDFDGNINNKGFCG